ncbi:capsular biosynthesis protein, partial [Cupriavidus taiwanensis]
HVVPLIRQARAVFVVTSQVGFEALLHGKTVHTFGMPFYAGWGLTDDRCEIPRRCRQLSLDMLVAGTLILYPRYVMRN